MTSERARGPPSRRGQEAAPEDDGSSRRQISIQRWVAWAIAARFVLDENLGDLRVPDRLAGIVRQQILFGDVGDVFGFRILGEQMIELLILVRPHLLGDPHPPSLCYF